MNEFIQMKEILEQTGQLELKEKSGSMFRFPLILTEKMREMDTEILELSVRSLNCLKRAQFNTIGDLVEEVRCSQDLKHIRSCGTKSIKEIMMKLFLYQYRQLPKEKRERYLAKVVEMNFSKYFKTE